MAAQRTILPFVLEPGLSLPGFIKELLRVNWRHADSNASLQQALRSMNPAMHGRSFPGERFRANRPESRTWLRTGRSESSSESPGTRESRRMLRQKGEC